MRQTLSPSSLGLNHGLTVRVLGHELINQGMGSSRLVWQVLRRNDALSIIPWLMDDLY